MLELTAREAHIIGLGLPPDASEPSLAEKIGWIRDAAGERFGSLELALNPMAVGQQVPRYVWMQLDELRRL